MTFIDAFDGTTIDQDFSDYERNTPTTDTAPLRETFPTEQDSRYADLWEHHNAGH